VNHIFTDEAKQWVIFKEIKIISVFQLIYIKLRGIKMKKRLISLMLAIFMILPLLPTGFITAGAEGTQYQMGTETVPLNKYTLTMTLNEVTYVITVDKDSDGNTRITGLDELRAAYPDGIPDTTSMKLEIFFDPSNISDIEEGDTIVYQLTDALTVDAALTGTIYASNGVTVLANYSVTSSGLITFTLNPDAGERFTSGRVYFDVSVNRNRVSSGNLLPVLIGGMEVDIPIEERTEEVICKYTVSKFLYNPETKANTGMIFTDDNGSYLVFGMKINAQGYNNNANVTGIVIKDIIPEAYQKYFNCSCRLHLQHSRG